MSNNPQRGRVEEMLTGFQRADNHQNKSNCVVLTPIRQSSGDYVAFSVPPSPMVNIIQFA